MLIAMIAIVVLSKANAKTKNNPRFKLKKVTDNGS